MTVTVTIAEREVGRVVRHGMTLGLDAETHIGEREVGIGGLGHGNTLHRIALLLAAH